MTKPIVQNQHRDGIDRRGFLKCMNWAGAGVLWSVANGIPASQALGQAMKESPGELHFVQISDSHIGFNKPANSDVVGTLRLAIEKINALPQRPDFIIHTGDLTHTSSAAEFDTLDQVLQSAHTRQVFFVPGEHDTAFDDGKRYLERYAKKSKGRAWYSFNHKDVHFVGLSNVAAIDGLGMLGQDQLRWLETDLKQQPASRPIVVFAHIPLWSVYPEWGWATEDSAQALSYLKRFGSVTILNGHIHQVMRKVEGAVTFHTATSTAFPQPMPGAAKGPGPLKIEANKLRMLLGLTEVHSHMTPHSLAITDDSLAPAPPAEAQL
jgi:Icc protein